MNVDIKDLTVSANGKIVLDKLNLHIEKGKVHVLMGPNGAGKSTLSKAIMNDPSYEVLNGDIICDNKSIISLDTDERAKMGIFLSFQNPISIEGVTNSEFLKMAINSNREEAIGLYDFINTLNKNYDDLSLPRNMMHRGINENFSGGERKKNEIIALKTLKPKFIILDEIDSGLDVDSLKIVCDNINNYVKEYSPSVLLITHSKKIFDYIKPDYVHVLVNGSIVDNGLFDIALDIDKNGYNKYINSSNNINEEYKNE